MAKISLLKIISISYVIVFPLWALLEMISFSISEGSLDRFFLNSSGDLTNHFAIWVGTLTGAFISLFFFWMDQRQKRTEKNTQEIIKELEKIKGTYSIRTYLWNLYDIFSGKPGRIQPTNKNRETYAERLTRYITDPENGIKEGDEVYQIWKKAQHDEIPDIEHNTRDCVDCKKIEEDQKKHFGTIFKHQMECEKCGTLAKQIFEYIQDPKNRNTLDPRG